jgi:hypothetical protein
LILFEHAQLTRTVHRAALRIELAGEQLHERRLAGTVRAGEAVAATRGKRSGDIVEE